ncbi:MAG: DUF1385 domain-containing protein, partial [Chloroflexi bacterium]|nr:DUF1385 domain-containing protein [Chloroflexota bacterium]
WNAAHEKNVIARALIAQGVWLQFLTTRVPDDQQIEVAVRAMNEALAADSESSAQPATPQPGVA